MSAPRRLSELLDRAGVRPVGPVAADPVVFGVGLDSRRIRIGEIFFALRGKRLDGATFAPEALKRGAAAVVAGVERPEPIGRDIAWVQVEDPRRVAGLLSREWFERPDEAMTLVAITGTNGKTTVTYLVEAIAAAAGLRAGRIGTVSQSFSGREVPSQRTTPEAPELYGLLAAMRAEGTQLVALEVSSHALALGRVDGARFPVAAFLNLGSDHLDFHGDVESYFAAKAALFERLLPSDTAVLPCDDARGASIAARTRARTVTFGRAANASVRLHSERCGIDGSEALLEISNRSLLVRTSLPGRFHLENVAAAAACALAAGLPADAIPAGVEAVRSIPGRTERVDDGQPFAVLVDFAHTEAALAKLLDGMRDLSRGRVLIVFGCGGERDRGKRPAMGRVAAERADLVFLTSDNPRGEDPVAILREIEAGALSVPGATGRYRVVVDRAEAVAAAIAAARAGDVVVIAGKGHETTQTFGNHVEHLDDREIARKALSAFGRSGGGRGGA